MTPSNEALEGLIGRRRQLMVACGLDALARPASDWLNMAVAAEERGHGSTQRDYFEAAEIKEAHSILVRPLKDHPHG